nr:hypothetical protein [Cytobacillus oceanisediminis]
MVKRILPLFFFIFIICGCLGVSNLIDFNKSEHVVNITEIERTGPLDSMRYEESGKRLFAEVKSCYDGDTCTVSIKSTGKEETIRFLLVDSSEIKGGPMPFAEDARDRLNDLVAEKRSFLSLAKVIVEISITVCLVMGFLKLGKVYKKLCWKRGYL